MINPNGSSCFAGDLDAKQAGADNLGNKPFRAMPDMSKLS
jgi:hypothetical protein